MFTHPYRRIAGKQTKCIEEKKSLPALKARAEKITVSAEGKLRY
jgi:hypothetical protein